MAGNTAPTFIVGGGVTVALTNVDDLATSLALTSGGGIVVAGDTDDGTGFRDFATVRLTPNGFADTSFAGSGFVTTDFTQPADPTHRDDHGQGVIVQSDGKIVTGGYSVLGASD